jgi:hypothetical protein
MASIPTAPSTSISIPVSTAYPLKNGIEQKTARGAASSPASG